MPFANIQANLLQNLSIGELQIRRNKRVELQIPPSPIVVLSSRQEEFHPKPLTEPYVKLSLHTALVIRIISNCKLSNDKT